MSAFIGKEVTYEALVTAWVDGTSLDDALTLLGVSPITDNHRTMLQVRVKDLRRKGLPLPTRPGEITELSELTPAKIAELSNLLS